MKDKYGSIIICSIVRNAARGLRQNIPTMKWLVRHFNSYKVVVFENDSTDNTKHLLQKWHDSDPENVHVFMKDLHVAPTIPTECTSTFGPGYSHERISKMVDYRNQYMDYVSAQGWTADYLMVIDLDVGHISRRGMLSCFNQPFEWDAITAFGWGLDLNLKIIYIDNYPAVLPSDQHLSRTKRYHSYMTHYCAEQRKLSKTPFPMFSAYGGAAIYKFDRVAHLRYQLLYNKDDFVECLCEHETLHIQMDAEGHNLTYVNPRFMIKYFTETLNTWYYYFKCVIRRKWNN